MDGDTLPRDSLLGGHAKKETGGRPSVTGAKVGKGSFSTTSSHLREVHFQRRHLILDNRASIKRRSYGSAKPRFCPTPSSSTAGVLIAPVILPLALISCIGILLANLKASIADLFSLFPASSFSISAGPIRFQKIGFEAHCYEICGIAERNMVCDDRTLVVKAIYGRQCKLFNKMKQIFIFAVFLLHLAIKCRCPDVSHFYYEISRVKDL
ncbi:hypothetical protein GOP47_0002447 [Adiantum capillus-veneris]|uniref:Uncharacterized protein n=1 Tax=Adiantum capillus-veneris TaxID=13818 RepID=A0A9D4ZP73_ADICA|nr:hypothetical protein GOP47_0002447 [Adiantum capillus-veneris]